MNRRMFTHGVLLAMLLTAPAMADGWEDKYEVKFAREQANATREFLAGFEADGKNAGEYFQEDLPEIRKWLDDHIAGWERAVTLYKDGKDADGKKEFERRASLQGNLWKMRGRLENRRRQSEATPTELWYSREMENTPATSIPSLNAWCEARKKYALAIGEYSKVWMPGTTDTQLREAQNTLRQVQTESEVAELRFRWSRENVEIIRDRAMSPELEEKVSAVQKLEDELSQIRRDRAELERRSEQVEQQRRETVDAARRLREAAMRVKREAGQRK